MNKRYQVFLSSTYADLREERSRVIQTLMEMDCIPSGMELFPAADEEQFEFIKKVIDDCDYYLLIIGGRYGTTVASGISYTEMEYEYAISRGLKVVALLHEQPDSIPVGKTDKDPGLARRLEDFREKVKRGRLVRHWRTVDELPGLVSLNLSKAIKAYPARGWVRGGAAASAEVLEEINELRKKNADLEAALASATPSMAHAIRDIAGLDASFGLSGAYQMSTNGQRFDWDSKLTFGELFALIGPRLYEHPNDTRIRIELAKAILGLQGKKPYRAEIEDQPFQTFKIQLQALGLITLSYTGTTKGGMALFWSLSKKGAQTLMQLRAVRSGG